MLTFVRVLLPPKLASIGDWHGHATPKRVRWIWLCNREIERTLEPWPQIRFCSNILRLYQSLASLALSLLLPPQNGHDVRLQTDRERADWHPTA
jgi:hypothetical protein